MVTVTSHDGVEREYDAPSFSLTEVAQAIGLGRTATYARAKKGTLPTVRMMDPTLHKKTRDGTLVRVSARTLDKLLHPEEYGGDDPFDAEAEEAWINANGGLPVFPSPFRWGKSTQPERTRKKAAPCAPVEPVEESVETPEPVEPEGSPVEVDADASWWEEYRRREQESREQESRDREADRPRVTLERRGEQEKARRRAMAAQMQPERPRYLDLAPDPVTGERARVYEDVLPHDATPEELAEFDRPADAGFIDGWDWF